MGSLKPGKAIAYERDHNGTVWARYHGETERWIVGGSAEKDSIYDYIEWQDLVKTARQNSTLHALLEKTINTYRLIKS